MRRTAEKWSSVIEVIEECDFLTLPDGAPFVEGCMSYGLVDFHLIISGLPVLIDCATHIFKVVNMLDWYTPNSW